MKVLTVAATPFFSNRGCHIRIYNEAKYLQKLGAFVEICTYHNGDNIEELNIHRIGEVSWYKKTSPGFAWGKLWLDLKLLFLCMKILKNSEFDIIHTHLFESLVIAKIAKFLTFKKIPIVLDLQGDLSDELLSYNKKNKIAGNLFVRFSEICFNWADAVVVSSQNSFEKIKEKYKPKKPFLIVGDGVDLDIFKNKTEEVSFSVERELEAIKKWKKNDRIIFYGGGMSDNKGVGELIRCFIDSEGESGWKLLLFGRGSDLDKYRELFEKEDFSEKICFAEESGYFQLPDYLELADVAIDPKMNSSESSAKLATYMAAELPIICFENDFNKKILGKSGFYLGSWKDFSLKLEELEKSDFSERIRYNLDKFNEENQVKILLGLFRKILS